MQLNTRPFLWLAAMGLLANACTDQPFSPALQAGSAALATSAGKPQLFPNSKAYQNSSKPNATGRAGSATVTARALVGLDGKTLVEVTTGQLDGGAAPAGNLDKVQVKGIIGPEVEPLFTKNHNGLASGGYFSASFGGLANGQVAQVQVNVSGIDRNRTGVVTLAETVKRRPDLAAAISAPSQGYKDAGIPVSATISEVNGDVGAKAVCVLYKDGVETDRAPGIWVNAGGSVSCAFIATFTTLGSHELKVAAETVVPGDWSLANNSAVATIQIIESTQPLHGWAYAQERSWDYKHAWDYNYGGNIFDYAHRQIGQEQYYYAYGNLPGSITFPVDVTLDERNGGVSLATSTFAGISGQSNWYYCDYRQDAQGAYVYVCNNNYWYNGGYYQYGRHGGSVTYYSANYAEWTGTDVAVYSWNDAGGQVWGSLLNWASDTLSPTLTLSDASGQSFKAAPVLSLTPFSNQWSGSYQDWYYYGYHSAWNNSDTGRSASTNF